ncbi:MAG TPA: hypothetical protein VER12_03755 [Polyangiaceae bacterium]|nr:hypothetical protein [Polyangiaceae bacterium]
MMPPTFDGTDDGRTSTVLRSRKVGELWWPTTVPAARCREFNPF